MHYCLNIKLFKKSLLEAGFKGLLDFSKKTKIHRNTLQGFLSGKDVFLSSFSALAHHLAKDPLDLIIPQSKISSKIKDLAELQEVVARLLHHDKKIVIVLLGSRAKKKAKEYSDWDLGVFRYPQEISGREYLKMKNITEEASENLVRKVDLINLNQAPAWFLKSLGEEVVFLEGHPESFLYFKGILHGIQKEQAA